MNGKSALLSAVFFVLCAGIFFTYPPSVTHASEDRYERSDRSDRDHDDDRSPRAHDAKKRLCERLEKTFERLRWHPTLPPFCTVTPPPPPKPTVDITATPDSIILGSTSTLSWTSSSASTCTASNGWNGSVPVSGSTQVSPLTTTTYTISCGNGTATTSDSVSVTVTTPPPLPTVSLTASPTSMFIDATSTLLWSTSGASYCEASLAWSGAKAFSGSTIVAPTVTSTYTLACGNSTGTTTKSATITVNSLPEPLVEIHANPESIFEGATSTVTWSSSNASTCTASDGWSGTKSTSGTDVISPAGTGTYTITCGNGHSTTSDSAVITVSPPPPPPPAFPTMTLDTSSDSINLDDSVTLTWSSTDATLCEATGGWSGYKNAAGNEIIQPTGTTTYTLSCGNTTGTTSDSVTVAVTLPDAPTVTLVADPTEVIGDQDVTTLQWSSTNATSCVASGAWSGVKATDGNEEVGPDVTSEYGLTCTGPGGVGSASTTVTFVLPPHIDHIVLSEVYYDTDADHGAEPGNEWVELYNPTNASVSLAGWSLTDGATTTDIISSGVTIAAHSYVILVASTTVFNFWTFPAGIPISSFASPIGNGLNNPGESLYLRDNASTTIDALSWGLNTTVFSPAIPGVIAGHSIARDSLTVDTDTAADWIDLATPTPGQ